MGQSCLCDKRSENKYKEKYYGTSSNYSYDSYNNTSSNNKNLTNFSLNESSSYFSNIYQNMAEQKKFLKGEKYYSIIKDSNKASLIENKNNWQSEKVELFFSLKNAINPNNLYSLSITIINNIRFGVDSYLGELDHNSGSNIDFGNSFLLDYFYERKQELKIIPIINGNEMEYTYSFILSDIMGNKNKTIEKKFTNFGTIRIKCKTIKSNENLGEIISNFKFNINLFNTNNVIPPNLFFVINHYKDGENKRPVYKSKDFNTYSIKTELIKIEADYLCYDFNKKILLELYSYYQNNQILIALGHFTLNQLKSNSSENKLTEISLKNLSGKNIGVLKIQYYQKKKISYLEKLSRNKMQINLEIAIDYTKSNKPPNDPSSNHYLNDRFLNDYEKAIKSCGEILAPYDSDQLFPVYGFGGIPLILNGRPNNKVSHCFNINFKENAEIHGIENVLNIYRESLNRVELSGNTKFSFFLKKVIDNINHVLKYKRKENHYYILLILTDGKVNDLKETIDLIVEASYLPLSIVIVGIGEEDFIFLKQLDGDKSPLTNSRGEKRKRDIVQFIKFNNFKNNNAISVGTDFAEEVLKEIPTQIEEYYSNVGRFY